MKMWILVFLVSFAVISSADDLKDKRDIFSCLPDGQISRLAYTNFEKLDEAVDKSFNGATLDRKDSPFKAPLSSAFAEDIQWKLSAYYAGGAKVYIYKIENLNNLVKEAKDRKYFNEVNLYYKSWEFLYVGDAEEYLATDTLPEKYLLAHRYDKELLFLSNDRTYLGKLIEAAKKKLPLAKNNPYYTNIFSFYSEIDSQELISFKVQYNYKPQAAEIEKYDQKIRQDTNDSENYHSLAAKGKTFRMDVLLSKDENGYLNRYGEITVLYFGETNSSPVNSSKNNYLLGFWSGSAESEEYIRKTFTKGAIKKELQ